MTILNWDLVRNKENTCAEFAACHENYAWRKHHLMKFGVLKKGEKKYADDSLTRAFGSYKDSIVLLFTRGNRVMQDNPEYGTPRFAVVWYKNESWAILCTPDEAVLIPSLAISNLKRQKSGAPERMDFLRRLWEKSEVSLRLPLSQVINKIAL